MACLNNNNHVQYRLYIRVVIDMRRGCRCRCRRRRRRNGQLDHANIFIFYSHIYSALPEKKNNFILKFMPIF